MKTFILTITVFVALNLGTASSTLALTIVAETAPATETDWVTTETVATGDSTTATSYSGPSIVRRGTSIVSVPYGTTQPYSAPVLVIPVAEIKPEDLLTIMEDMNVMSRIFDKQLVKANLIKSPDYSWIYSRRPDSTTQSWWLSNLHSRQDGQATETIYLEGFGAIFLMGVDFPLVPTPKVEEEKKTEEPVDSVWAETKQEIYMPDAVKKTRESPPAEEYDAEKVEKLKTTLTNALKHAANIRALKPQDWVILTVTGSGEPAGVTITADARTGSIIAYDKGKNVTKIYKGPAPFPDDLGFPIPTVLTLCAKKSDIDAFAEGELDFDKFRQRTKIFTSYAQSGRGGLPSVEVRPVAKVQSVEF